MLREKIQYLPFSKQFIVAQQAMWFWDIETKNSIFICRISLYIYNLFFTGPIDEVIFCQGEWFLKENNRNIIEGKAGIYDTYLEPESEYEATNEQ